MIGVASWRVGDLINVHSRVGVGGDLVNVHSRVRTGGDLINVHSVFSKCPSVMNFDTNGTP